MTDKTNTDSTSDSTNSTTGSTSSNSTTKTDTSTRTIVENDSNAAQVKKNKQLREKFKKEIAAYEKTSNKLLDGIRDYGVSIHSVDGATKKRPEEISDIHILFCQQKPKYVHEGKADPDTSVSTNITTTTKTGSDTDSSSSTTDSSKTTT